MKKIGLLLLTVSLISLGTLWAATAYSISQKNKTFSQSEITVKVGDTINFVNDDDVAHSIFCSAPGFEFNKTTKPGETADMTVQNEGTFEVRCAIHPKMKITIHVEK